jgi:GMP synthase PP-ATPase subunit
MVTAKETVKYDGYYFVDVVAKNGHKLTIPARGYNLRSWINFEKSLGSIVEYRVVSEKEWMTTHWTQIPWTETQPVKSKVTKKASTKKTAKKLTSKL